MNKYLRLGAAILAVSSLSACATITRGTKQKFAITSMPAGADVALSTGETCVTPCKLKLKRKKEFTAHFSKSGFAPMDVAVKSEFKGGAALAGNALLGGLIGAGVDASNGSLNSLTPNPLQVTLVSEAAPAPATGDTNAAVAEPAPAATAGTGGAAPQF